MTEFNVLPPEETLPEEYPAPAPGIYPPPEEGSSGEISGEDPVRRHGQAPLRGKLKSALLFAAAGLALCAALGAAPKQSDAEPQAPAETTLAELVTEPAPTQVPTQTTEPAAPTAAERLIAVGTWKNSAEAEWVHFDAGGTGWWYDGTYFGRMRWEESADGGVRYEAAMAYLSPERDYSDDYAPEKEGDSLHSISASGSIALLSEEDRFACPGLRFGAGDYLPDDTPIDASVMEGVRGIASPDLASGSVWRMTQTSDLGIPCAPSAEGGKPELYTDLVYVQSLDFAAGSFRLTTRDGGLLQFEERTADGRVLESGEPADALDVPFALTAEEDASFAARLGLVIDVTFIYRSAYRPGDTEYNNMHLLWGMRLGPAPIRVYLLFTDAGLRLGVNAVDYYPNNYTLLSPASP